MQTEVVSNLSYVNGDLDEFISYMNHHHISQRRGAMIATVNPEIGYAVMKDQTYHQVVSSADYVFAGWCRRRLNVTFDTKSAEVKNCWL